MPEASREKVLIVDDETKVCEVLSRYLTDEGYQCAKAGSGEAALKILEGERFDLIIIDIMMPGMSGIDLLNVLRTLFPEVATLMVTAVDDKDTGIHALELGACGYMIKPFKRNEVPINVANALRLQKERLAASRRGQAKKEIAQAAQAARIEAKSKVDEIVQSVKSGMDDASLMKKFDLSASGLQAVLHLLVEDGLLKEPQLKERASLAPGSVVLDVPRMTFPEPASHKPVIKADDAVAAIRAGIDDLSLMKTFGISAKGLSSLFRKLVDAGRLKPEEVYARPKAHSHIRVVEDLQRLRKHYLALSAPVFDPTAPEQVGSIRNITEKGIGITGIRAKVGEVRTLVIPTREIPQPEHIWFEAVCLWSGQDEPTGEAMAAFQITKISDESLRRLRVFIGVLSLSE